MRGTTTRQVTMLSTVTSDSLIPSDSFRPKDGDGSGGSPPPGRNPEVNYHGERRSNETHQSSTDHEARLARNISGMAAKLSYAGHLLMEQLPASAISSR